MNRGSQFIIRNMPLLCKDYTADSGQMVHTLRKYSKSNQLEDKAFPQNLSNPLLAIKRPKLSVGTSVPEKCRPVAVRDAVFIVFV